MQTEHVFFHDNMKLAELAQLSPSWKRRFSSVWMSEPTGTCGASANVTGLCHSLRTMRFGEAVNPAAQCGLLLQTEKHERDFPAVGAVTF